MTEEGQGPSLWVHLRDQAIPQLLARRPAGAPLRAWVTGCATGEEVYALTMVVSDALEHVEAELRPNFRIFATDIDADALDIARAGAYTPGIARHLCAERLSRFFKRDGRGYRIREASRDKVIFAVQDVALDPPFTRLDLLVCRNLLGRLAPALQRRLFSLFHRSLQPGGLLLLGAAETVAPSRDCFAPLHGEFKLYRRLPGPGTADEANRADTPPAHPGKPEEEA